MTALAVLAITLPLIGFFGFDAWVAGFVYRAAAEPPRDRLLMAVAYVLAGVTIGVGCAAALGIASVVYNATGARILPFPLPTVLIYVAVIAASLGVIPLYRYIRAKDS